MLNLKRFWPDEKKLTAMNLKTEVLIKTELMPLG